MKDIFEIVESLEDFGLLPKGVSKTIQNETIEETQGFLSMLLGTLGKSLLGNISAGKGTSRAGKEIVRAGYGNEKDPKTITKRQDHENRMDF